MRGKTIGEFITEAHANARDKGFYDKEKNIGEMIALIHSELSEGLEAHRKGRFFEGDLKVVWGWCDDKKFKEEYEARIKGTFEEEMADIAIRLFDLCGFLGIDLETHIRAKMRYNSLRERKHGKKY